MANIPLWIKSAWLSGMTKKEIREYIQEQGNKLTLFEAVQVIQIYDKLNKVMPDGTSSRDTVEADNFKRMQSKNK